MSAQLQQSIADGLATALATQDEMVTGWVAVVETIDSDGERGLWTMRAADTTPWQALGYLESAAARERVLPP